MTAAPRAGPHQRRRRAPGVRHVDPVDGAVVPDGGLGVGLPVDGAAVDRVYDPEEVGVLQLDEEPGPLAEVAPQGVAHHLRVGAAQPATRGVVGVEAQHEARLAIGGLLPGPHGVGEEARRGPRI